MANRLADLNRQKREYAASGRGQEGDIHWLYEQMAQQQAANRPAGIGGPGGGMEGEGEGAPNPMAGIGGIGSGGASGAADTGMPGPGQTGLGSEGDAFYRAIVAGREGGQHGEGIGMSENPYADPSGFGTVGSIGGMVTGIPGLGLIGSGIGAAYDYEVAKQFDPSYDFSLGSFLSSFGNMATGGLFGDESQLGEAIGRYQDATGTGLSPAALSAAVTGGNFSGPKGVTGRSSYGGGGAEGSGYQDVGGGISVGINERGEIVSAAPTRDDRGGRGAESGGSGRGAGGGGPSGGPGGSMGGRENWHDGGIVSEQEVPGQMRGDVDATLQEGEGVLTADAVQVLGPGFVDGVNMMARMLRTRGGW